MDILHILRSAPDSETEKMISGLSDDRDANVVKLYETEIDWEHIVEAIFSHNQVVCW